MPIPKYFINERQKALKEREKNLGQILAKLGPQDKDGVSLLMNWATVIAYTLARRVAV